MKILRGIVAVAAVITVLVLAYLLFTAAVVAAANNGGYQILQAQNAEDLEALVRDAMADGWEPQGGVSITYIRAVQIHYAQAVVKGRSR